MKQNRGWFMALVLGFLLAAGCTSAEYSDYASLGKPAHVTLYSGDKAVREWDSTGKVLSVGQSDGWYFTDKATGNLVTVSGAVVMEIK